MNKLNGVAIVFEPLPVLARNDADALAHVVNGRRDEFRDRSVQPVEVEPTLDGGGLGNRLGIPYPLYPAIYALRLVVTLGILASAWPTIRSWLGRPSWWPPLVGLALVIPWVVLAALQREAGWMVGGSGRSAFDPFKAFAADDKIGRAHV